MRIRIASRKSDLARIQAYMVGDALVSTNSDLKIDYAFSASLGDKNQDDPLWKMPTQGVFTQDFRQGLMDGDVDLVVHSWKDLPVENDGTTLFGTTLPRADHRDLLLVKKSALGAIKQRRQLNLLSSSPRRIHNLSGFLCQAFPGGLDEVKFSDVRGNIQTRLNKMLVQDADGLIVAKAAIDRLLTSNIWSRDGDGFEASVAAIQQSLAQCNWMVLPASHNPPAAAQGALMIEVAAGRAELIDLLKDINCPQTFEDVSAEREILKSHGGGCHQKIGVWVQQQKFGRVVSLRGETETGDKLEMFELQNKSNANDENSLKQNALTPVKSSDLFDRIPLEVTRSNREKMAAANALLITSSAVPDQYLDLIEDQIVWASGVKSWFAIAAKGIWVHGCDDNLGATTERGIDVLLGEPASWLNLTHADSPSLPAIHTYRLEPNISGFETKGAQYFYWRSGFIV